MNLLPHEDLTIITKLKPDEAEFALRTKIILYDPVGNTVQYDQRKSYLFIGSINDGKFNLKCNENYNRKTIIPIIKGIIEPYENGSKVYVKIILSYRILIPCLYLLVFESILILAAIMSKEWAIILLAIFLLPVAYLGIKFDLASNSVSIKSDLKKIFA
jgi:hypothetical protein